ncbi:MAG: N-acetyl-gamma-glutamyl-phosphate reductase [Sandaracinaceae bacterium]
MTHTSVRASVVGATGYTGGELVRLLRGHPHVELGSLVGHRSAGAPVAEALPSLAGLVSGTIQSFDADRIAGESEVAFCGLPHGASAEAVDALRARGVKVFDLSADFRLRNVDLYQEWYGAHPKPERLGEAVYGLVERHRHALRAADLVAVPGCYPTASIIPVAPIASRVSLQTPIIIDAKSGVSGAGRDAKPRTHFSETAEGFRAYAIAGRHRHTPEIEQELALAAGRAQPIVFSPHLVPMIRGILATAYLTADRPLDPVECTAWAREDYAGSPSVHVLDPDTYPDTAWVRGSNRLLLSYTQDARSGMIVAQGALDNLVKGAAGQAIQAMNVRFGWDEGAGLTSAATWP